jgi:predicted nucleic acid-binding protein
VAALWDTTLASRIEPGGDVLEYVLARATDGRPVRVASPTILEIAYGHQRMADVNPRYSALLAWLTGLLARDVLTIVALDGRAAIVAGRLRGVLPYPPGKRDRRSKPTRQASWLLDIEIAATAFAAGLDVATDNRRDFEVLSDELIALFPEAPPMSVVAGPV